MVALKTLSTQKNIGGQRVGSLPWKESIHNKKTRSCQSRQRPAKISAVNEKPIGCDVVALKALSTQKNIGGQRVGFTTRRQPKTPTDPLLWEESVHNAKTSMEARVAMGRDGFTTTR